MSKFLHANDNEDNAAAADGVKAYSNTLVFLRKQPS